MANRDLISSDIGRGGGGSSGGDDISGGYGGGGGGVTATKIKSSTTGGARVQVHYNTHLPALSLQDGEKLHFHPGGDGPPDPSWCSYLQELALIHVLLGALQLETLASPYPPQRQRRPSLGCLRQPGGMKYVPAAYRRQDAPPLKIPVRSCTALYM